MKIIEFKSVYLVLPDNFIHEIKDEDENYVYLSLEELQDKLNAVSSLHL